MGPVFAKQKRPVVAGGRIDNVLGANTTFSGHLKSDGNVRIDGVFVGTIETAGNLILGEYAKVEADITANAVQVWGAVKGNIVAASRLEIMSTGRVWGDISVASLLIDEGGLFRGQSVMGSGEEHFLIEAPRPPEVKIIELGEEAGQREEPETEESESKDE
jgi:cytoskeletal protein CcmA (bactofilin family)